MVCLYHSYGAERNLMHHALQMATLSVQEAMGSKVDREAVATLVLPQLWSMSMGPRESVEDVEVLPDAHLRSQY